jgi:hypothetical protein
MAQGLVTYLGGATRSNQWLESLANPATASTFFEDGFSGAAFSADTTVATDGKNGRITTGNAAAATTTTSLAVLANAPAKLAFEVKGAFGGTGVDGIVGLLVINSNTVPVFDTTVGCYFRKVNDDIVFRIRYDGSTTKDVKVAAYSADERRLGFEWDNNEFRVYHNGALVGEVSGVFPTGAHRLVAGKVGNSATANRFVSFDYALVSVPR